MDSLQQLKSKVLFTPEEHLILREMKGHHLIGKPLLVAVSGGLDSVLCLHLLQRLRPVLKNELTVACIHHGAGPNKKFRDQSVKFVQKMCQEMNIPFFTNKPEKIRLKSENDLREYRHAELTKILQKLGESSILVLAHHQDDLLETQFMRLMRGTGQGGLQGFSFFSESKLRPLIFFRRKVIKDLAKKLKVQWLDDPSNESTDPLRNWLRRRILAKIEIRAPGSLNAMARSFALIAANNESKRNTAVSVNTAIPRRKFLALSRGEQSQLIVKYLQKLNIWDYSKSQVDEIIHRLDNRRGHFKFDQFKHEWRVNSGHIRAQKKPL